MLVLAAGAFAAQASAAGMVGIPFKGLPTLFPERHLRGLSWPYHA